MKESRFYSIPLDESTDIAGLPQLFQSLFATSTMLLYQKIDIFCKALKLHAKGEDIFQCLNDFFTEYFIPWEECAGICTDDAAAFIGLKSRVVKQVEDKAPNAKWTHCFLH